MNIIRPELSTTKKLDDNRPMESHHPKADFKTILDDSIKISEQKLPSSHKPLKANFSPLAGISPLSYIDKTKNIEKIENFLNTLDSYHQKLGDQVRTLKDIGPVVDKIATESESITELYESLPKNDALKQILNEVLIISSMEIAKFNRGDYIDI